MTETIVAAIQIQELDGQLLVDSRLIAGRLGIQHEALIRTINKYLTELQAFGVLRFENGKLESVATGRPQRFVYLNEAQATLLMTMSRNTAQVVQCKVELVSAFEKAKEIIKTAIAPAPPQRDPIEYVAAAKTIETLRDPLMRSLLSQRIYEVLQGQPALPGTTDRLVCVAVRAGELGFRLGAGEDSALGKYIRARFSPEGQLPHGRYQVNAYKLTPLLDEAIRGFFYALNGED